MNYQSASKLDRFIANLIDGLIINLVSFTFIGIPIAIVYYFLKDSLEFMNYQSLGKKLMKIRVVNYNYQNISGAEGFKRNILLVIPIWGLIESLMYLFGNSDQRTGDRFAETYVIKAEESYLKQPSKDNKNRKIDSNIDNIDNEIRKLSKLKDDGLINDKEFSDRKKKILDI